MKKIMPVLIIFCFVLVMQQCFAQTDVPELKLKEPGLKKIELRQAQVDTKILGFLAETSFYMEFANPNSRTLEGELIFPLPDGAVVSGFALDIDGEMIDGVAVEKEEAQKAFETEVRKGADPAILEKVAGNSFRTRIYPIPAGKSRKVKISFITSLKDSSGFAQFRLPVSFSKDVDKFRVRVFAPNQLEEPEILDSRNSKVKFVKKAEGYLLELNSNDGYKEKELVINFPYSSPGNVFVEKSNDGKTYFCIQQKVPHMVQKNKVSPARKVVVFYDISESGKNRDQVKELDFMDYLFKSDVIDSSANVEIIPFSNELHSELAFSTKAGEVNLLKNKISALDFDGGTNLSCVKDFSGEAPDFYLLFTDGMSNFGEEKAGSLNAPVFAFSSSIALDSAALNALCNQSGGKLFNLMTDEKSQIKNSFFSKPTMYIPQDSSSLVFSNIYPAKSQPVDSIFMLYGIIENGSKENLKIHFATGESSKNEFEFQVSDEESRKGETLRKLWAGKAIEGLSGSLSKNKKEIVRIAKKHGIVTNFTSFIVLETVAQYLEHKIIPPASKKDWRDEYFRVLEEKEQSKKDFEFSKLAKVIEMWKRRLEWWNRDFSKATGIDKIKKDRSPMLGGAAPTEDSFGAVSESTRPQSAPEPMRSINRRELEEMDSVSLESKSALMDEVRPAKKGNSDKEERLRTPNPGVAIKAWSPDTPYAKKLKSLSGEALFKAYIGEKVEYGTSPAFYLDCADIFIADDNKKTAVRVLSNVAEMGIENAPLLRILAHRLAQIDELSAAKVLFERVLEFRTEEPQSYRDLALVLARLGESKKAIDLLYEVVLKNWDGRFREIEVIALEEINNIIQKADKDSIKGIKVDSALITQFELDLRIVMTWDADQTDMDLWVIEPTGEKAYYSNPLSRIGGLVSKDFTRGYGPEEYLLKKARTGTYTIKTNFFGSQAQKVSGAVTLQVDVYTNYGRPEEKRKSVTLRLKESKETFTVAEIEF